MRMLKTGKMPFWAFVALYSLAYCLLADVAEFADLPLDGLADTAYMLGYFGAIALMQAAIVCLIALNRYVFAVASTLLMLSGAGLTYFFVTLRTRLSPAIVGLGLSNDFTTSSDLITWPLVLSLLAALAVSAAFAYVRFRHVRDLSRARSLGIGGLCAVFLVAMLSVGKIKTVAEQRQPFVIASSVSGYLALRTTAADERHTFDDTPSQCASDTVVVVLVLGESMRPDHLGLNGYERNTTPLLSAIPNLVSYPGLRVSTFHTAISIPRIMTRADDEHPEIGYEEQSFITLFKRAGFATSWIANQEPINSFAYFMAEADTLVNAFVGHSHYNYDRWLDGDMLPHFDRLLAAPAPKKLIVLHTIGSHWWYNTHYTSEFAVYKPELASRNINANSRAQFVNSYDNCALYTDWFLAQLIGRLEGQNAVLVYISDHGEGLGEDGALLHGQPSEGTSQAALIFWTSDEYAAANPSLAAAMVANQPRRISNDILFHTILDVATISTPAADTTLSLARLPQAN